MPSSRMALLTTVRSGFHGRVIAARLGADGIPTQLRGAVDGPYPMGDVLVYVFEDDLSTARSLLAADAEAHGDAGDGAAPVGAPGRRVLPAWMVVAVLALVGLALMARW